MIVIEVGCFYITLLFKELPVYTAVSMVTSLGPSSKKLLSAEVSADNYDFSNSIGFLCYRGSTKLFNLLRWL